MSTLRPRKQIMALLAAVTSAIFLVPVSQAGAATQANACVNNILVSQASSIPITMNANSPNSVAPGGSITLSNISQQAAIPPTVFLSGYSLELLELGLNKVPTKVQTTIAATNTTQGVQDTNLAEGFAETTIADPTPENPASGDETATPGAISVTYADQTWTAKEAGTVKFREATLKDSTAQDPPGFSYRTAGVTIEALVGPGGVIKAKFGCNPGNVVEQAEPKTIKRVEEAVPFASVQVKRSGSGSGSGSRERGVALAAALAPVKGGKALVKLRCRRGGRCKGIMKLIAQVKRLNRGHRSSRGVRNSRRRNLRIGRKSFSIAAGKAKTVRVRLTRRGRVLVRHARRRGVKVKLRGRGVRARTVRLRERRHGR